MLLTMERPKDFRELTDNHRVVFIKMSKRSKLEHEIQIELTESQRELTAGDHHFESAV